MYKITHKQIKNIIFNTILKPLFYKMFNHFTVLYNLIVNQYLIMIRNIIMEQLMGNIDLNENLQYILLPVVAQR